MSHEAHVEAHGGEHPPTTIREYVLIGAVLTVVTAVELWCSYNVPILGSLLIPVLVLLSAFKFVVVVGMFMHLRFENGLLLRVFLAGLLLALLCCPAGLRAQEPPDEDQRGIPGHGYEPHAAPEATIATVEVSEAPPAPPPACAVA